MIHWKQRLEWKEKEALRSEKQIKSNQIESNRIESNRTRVDRSTNQFMAISLPFSALICFPSNCWKCQENRTINALIEMKLIN